MIYCVKNIKFVIIFEALMNKFKHYRVVYNIFSVKIKQRGASFWVVKKISFLPRQMKNRTETVGEKMMNELKTYIFGKNHKCKTCGSRCIWNKKSEFQLRCTWIHCKRKFSALEGSIAYKN
jgi:hypothetical protein